MRISSRLSSIYESIIFYVYFLTYLYEHPCVRNGKRLFGFLMKFAKEEIN